MRCRRFGLDDPLLNQFVEQLIVAFGAALDELLERAKLANLGLQNNVAFDSRNDPVHDSCRL
jgi:hypothetical protein